MQQSCHITCFSCHKTVALEAGQKILKNEECSFCYAAMHSCRMCRHYDHSAYNQCREPSAERIVEKEKANYCDYFVLGSGESQSGDPKTELMNKFNSLFKN